jgi:hypothetical protein
MGKKFVEFHVTALETRHILFCLDNIAYHDKMKQIDDFIYHGWHSPILSILKYTSYLIMQTNERFT